MGPWGLFAIVLYAFYVFLVKYPHLLQNFLLGGQRPSIELLRYFVILALLGHDCCLADRQPSFLVIFIIYVSIFYLTYHPSFTCRWPLALPVSMFAILHVLFYAAVECDIFDSDGNVAKIASRSFPILGGICIGVSTLLCILFPPLQLGQVTGRYAVGVVNAYLPMKEENVKNEKKSGSVSTRIFYPSNVSGSSLYLDEKHGALFTNEVMKVSGPPPLRPYSFLIDHWRLVRIPAAENAPAATISIDNTGKEELEVKAQFPVIIFSHGLMGNSRTYTYQAMELASHGYVVVLLDHGDGSSSFTIKEPQNAEQVNLVPYDFDIFKHYDPTRKENVDYVRARRAQMEIRVKEILSAMDAILHLNKQDESYCQTSFQNKLTKDMIFMGHSFGGAASLSAAAVARPGLVRSILVQDPAIDWMTDVGRHALFDEVVVEGNGGVEGIIKKDGNVLYDGGTGGYRNQSTDMNNGGTSPEQPSLHNTSINMQFLYSNEWQDANWGNESILDHLITNNHIGAKNQKCELAVIKDMKHNESSDVHVLMPFWLSKVMNAISGKRQPLDVHRELMDKSLQFLDGMKQQQ